MKHRRRLPIPQHEFGFARQAFNLMAETTLDGERLARELSEMRRRRELAEQAQSGLFSPPATLSPQAV